MSTQGFGQKIWSKGTLRKTRHVWEDDITFYVILYRLYLKKETKIGGVWLVCDEVGISVRFIYDAYMLRLVVMRGLFVTS